MVIKNVELTPEMVARLNGFAPINSDAKFDYVPIVYRSMPEEVRPVFKLRRLNGTEVLKQMDALRGKVEFSNTGTGTVAIARGQMVIDVCNKGIVGWSNYIDIRTGKEIEYKDVSSITILPDKLMEELCNAITEGMPLAEEEVQGLG